MTSFLKIAYNKIPRISTAITASAELSGSPVALGPNNLPAENLFYGGSTLYWKSGDYLYPFTKTKFRLTLGSSYAGETIDYIAIRGLNLMFANGSGALTVEVRGSNDNFVSNNVQLLIQSGITAANLVGPFLEDYVLTGTLSAAYKAFDIIITSTNNVQHRYRKIYIGKMFEFTRNGDGFSPFYPYTPGYGNNGTPFTADTGSIFKTSTGRRARVLSFAWRGVSDAERILFDSEIREFLSDYPIWLYETNSSTHSPLNNDKLVFGWADADVQTKDWKNNNQVMINFREDIVG